MRPSSQKSRLLLAVVAAGIAGCGSEGVPLADVTGLITFNGRPAQAEILFEPVGEPGKSGGRPSVGYADRTGRFQLGWSPERTGAEIGRHRVLIKVLRGAEAKPRSLEEATTPLKTVRLERTVREGDNHFAFVLTP